MKKVKILAGYKKPKVQDRDEIPTTGVEESLQDGSKSQVPQEHHTASSADC